jgi:hypothetical protein
MGFTAFFPPRSIPQRPSLCRDAGLRLRDHKQNQAREESVPVIDRLPLHPQFRVGIGIEGDVVVA